MCNGGLIWRCRFFMKIMKLKEHKLLLFKTNVLNLLFYIKHLIIFKKIILPYTILIHCSIA